MGDWMISHIMKDYQFLYSGPLLYKSSLLKEDVRALSKICNANKKIKHNHNLAGAIKDEYVIQDMDSVGSIFKKYMKNFSDVHQHWYNFTFKSFEFTSIWTNFMKAGEYNPPHTHENCNFSSVFFIDVPDKIAKEDKSETKGTKPGQLEFLITPNLPGYISSYVVTPVTGDFFIFPSTLMHYVNPFKSKVTRVTMAANIIMKN